MRPVIVPTLFLLACSAGSDQDSSAAASTGNPCLVAAVVSGDAIEARCDVGYVFNEVDYGVTTRVLQIGSSRGCDEITGETDVELPTGTSNVKVTLDESTGKLTYHTSAAGDVSLQPSVDPDSLWVGSYRPGDSEEVRQKIGCPGLDDAVAELARDRSEPASCENGEPDEDGSTSVTFQCDELDDYLAGNEVYLAMFTGENAALVGMGHILVSDLRGLAAERGTGSRAMVAGGIGLLFGSLFSFSFQEQNFNISDNFKVGYNPTNYATYNY